MLIYFDIFSVLCIYIYIYIPLFYHYTRENPTHWTQMSPRYSFGLTPRSVFLEIKESGRKTNSGIDILVYIHKYTQIYTSMSIYIYIYREREIGGRVYPNRGHFIPSHVDGAGSKILGCCCCSPAFVRTASPKIITNYKK